MLLGFLALSALTLATFAWHPLQRLETGAAADGPTAGGAGRRRLRSGRKARRPSAAAPRRTAAPPVSRRDDVGPPVRREPPDRRPEEGPQAEPKEPPRRASRPRSPTLPPIDLLTAAAAQDIDAGEAQLDRLGQSLLETLRTFKVEGHDRRPDDRAGGDAVRGGARRRA